MAAWSVAAPFWWLWRLLWLVLTRSWAVAILIAVVSTAYLVFRHRRRRHQTERSKPKTGRQAVTDPSTLIPDVLKVLPVHSNNGWVLVEVSHGLRVFNRFFPALSFSGLPCLAASTLVEMGPKKALQQATSSRELADWVGGLSMPPLCLKQPKGSRDNDSDLIRVTLTSRVGEAPLFSRLLATARRRMADFTEQYASFLEGLFRLPADLKTETLERVWQVEGESLCHMLTIPKEPSTLPYHWSLLVFTALRNKGASVGLSIATLVMLPRAGVGQLSSILASELSSLREHVLMKNLKAYSLAIPQHSLEVSQKVHSAVPSPGRKSPAERVKPTKPVKQPAKQVRQANRHQELPQRADALETRRTEGTETVATPPPVATANHIATDSQNSVPRSSPTTPPSDRFATLNAEHMALAEEKVQKLLALSRGTEQDGWIPIGTSKDVFMTKMPPSKGEQLNIARGNGIIRAPPTFILRVLKNPKYTTQLDEMMKESRPSDRLTDCIRLVHLLYKGIWPTAPRDFALLNISGKLNDNTWIHTGLSIVDPRIPEEKGHVRGHLVVGGFVIMAYPDNPEMSDVTYATKVDLKGSVPSFVVNKVTSSQPLNVHTLRCLVEPLYAQMKRNPQQLRENEEAFPIGVLFPKKASPEPEATAPRSTSLPKATSFTATNLTATPKLEAVRSSSSPQLRAAAAAPQSRGDTNPGPDGRKLGKSQNPHQIPELHEQSLRAELLENGPRFSTPITELDGSSTPQSSQAQVRPATHHWNSKPAPAFAMANENGIESGHESENESRGEETEEGAATAAANPAESSPNPMESSPGSSTPTLENDIIIMESIEAYTPEEISSDEEGRTGEGGAEEEGGRGAEGQEDEVFSPTKGPSFELKLPRYSQKEIELEQSSNDSRHQSLTEETITYPRLGSEVDYKTMGNQAAAKVLEEVFHAGNLDLTNPSTYPVNANGWKYHGKDKDVIILQKKSPDSPFDSFLGKGIIELPPQEVFDSIRNPQLRFTYDSMLKGLHIVKRIEDGLYILHLQHETTQCFMKQARDFCILANERSEPNKKMLVGISIDVPECPPNPNCTRGKIYYSGWVVEPYRINGRIHTEITYLLQTDVGGLPASLVNHISKRQPLAIAYLREYLISTSHHISSK